MSLQLNIRPGDRVLELGGGANPALKPECQGGTAVCVDVRMCHDELGNRTVDFVCDFNEPLPIESDSFDAAFSQYAVEHISWRKLKQFLAEVFRVLKPGAKFVCITPNAFAQIEWIKNNLNGWDDKSPFESFSCVLFGDCDYPENSHKSFIEPQSFGTMLQELGFVNITIKPFGARNTDMITEVTKPGVITLDVQQQNHDLSAMTTEEIYDKHYFHGGKKVGGYAREGYRDFPVHEVTFKHLLDRHPSSVLEIGCARGYIVKRLQDKGIRACGMEISRHCYLTRVCDGILRHNICDFPWPWKNKEFDLCFSMATLEHVPERFLGQVFAEMSRVSNRVLHGVDFGQNDDGFDKTHCTLRPQEWWLSHNWNVGLDPFEIVDKEELERGQFPQSVVKGDGKVKLNLGSFTNMFHHGWLNLDVLDLYGFAQANGYHFAKHDVREGLKNKTGEVDLIFMSHFLEYITYQEATKLLKDCRRVLKPDGAMRIIVPDADLLISRAYGIGLDDLAEISDSVENAKTQLQKLHELLYANHQAIYNTETLIAMLNESGFTARKVSFRLNDPQLDGRTNHHAGLKQILRETIDMLPSISLFVDAIPLVS